MYIEAVPNRASPPAILLRESYRDGGKVKKRTLLNLSDWPAQRIAGFTMLLKGGTVIPHGQQAITITRIAATMAAFRRSGEARVGASLSRSSSFPASSGTTSRYFLAAR